MGGKAFYRNLPYYLGCHLGRYRLLFPPKCHLYRAGQWAWPVGLAAGYLDRRAGPGRIGWNSNGSIIYMGFRTFKYRPFNFGFVFWRLFFALLALIMDLTERGCFLLKKRRVLWIVLIVLFCMGGRIAFAEVQKGQQRIEFTQWYTSW